MQVQVATTDTQRPGALETLFVRFVTGEIEESILRQISGIVDSNPTASVAEREAMAAFVNDAVTDLGSAALRLPTEAEASDMLEEIRLAA